MPTLKQEDEFTEHMAVSLEEVKAELFSLQFAIEWIAENLTPDDVFRVSQLEEWAEQNNYEPK